MEVLRTSSFVRRMSDIATFYFSSLSLISFGWFHCAKINSFSLSAGLDSRVCVRNHFLKPPTKTLCDEKLVSGHWVKAWRFSMLKAHMHVMDAINMSTCKINKRRWERLMLVCRKTEKLTVLRKVSKAFNRDAIFYWRWLQLLVSSDRSIDLFMIVWYDYIGKLCYH